MADVALGIAGAAVGGVVGGTQGALLGWSVGTLLGGALFPPKGQTQQTGKLDDAARRVVGSAYGVPLPLTFGTIAVGGNVIWATDLAEHVVTHHSGKGGGRNTEETFTYTVDLAVSFGRGPRRVKRIWLEDILVWDGGGAIGNHTVRIYDGDEVQGVDPRVEAVEGTGEAPAYRGQCYAVFEQLLLTDWGNRVPAAIRAELEPVGGGPEDVGDVLGYLFSEVGIGPGDRDLTGGGAGSTVRGYAVTARVAARDACAPVLTFAASTLQEADGVLRLVGLDAAVQGTVPAGDLGAVLWGSKADDHAVVRLAGRLLDDLDLPVHADLNYVGEAFRGYERSTASRERFSKTATQERLSVDLPLVLSEAEAAGLVTRLLYEQWRHGEQFNFTLPPRSGVQLVPGDLWFLPVGGDVATVRVTRTDWALPLGVVEVEAVLYEPGIVTQDQGGAGLAGVNDSVSQPTDTFLIAWAGNGLVDADSGQVGCYLAANGATVGDWPGCAVYWSRDGGLTYQLLAALADPVTYGETDSTLAAPPANVGTAAWDDVSTVDLTLTAGTAPTTLSDAEVLNGANGVRFETGEVVQFAVVTALGGGQYRLSRLLRGRQGTDPDWGAHATGEQVTFLAAGAVRHQALADDLVGRTVLLRGVTVGQAVADAADVSLLVTGDEWRPWSGADGRGARDAPATGDWTITWERRARSGGAWTDFADALNPDAAFGGYDLEVWDATYTTLKRTFAGIATPVQVYLAADQTTDFGSPQGTLYLRAFQLGRFGRSYSYDFSATSP